MGSEYHPLEVLIGGVPGTLKTTTAVLLGSRLDLPVVGTDQMRAVQRVYDDSPFLLGTTHTRWELLGTEEENLTTGVLLQSELVRTAVLEVEGENLSRGQDQIIEGVHLIPQLYPSAPWRLRVLLHDPDLKRLHMRMQEKFVERPEMAKPWTEGKIRQVDKIQRWLLDASRYTDVLVIEALRPEYCSAMIIARLRQMDYRAR